MIIGHFKFRAGQNALELRGWEYPAILRGAPDVVRERTQQYFELSNDWQNHIEFWRMYKSGQFLHYLALREDWLSADQLASLAEQGLAPGTGLVRLERRRAPGNPEAAVWQELLGTLIEKVRRRRPSSGL